MTIRILPNRSGVPAHKLADVELVFEDGPLAGLKLVGIAVWATREGGDVSITFPARSYQGETGLRYFNFLRPDAEGTTLDGLKTAIRDEYARAVTSAHTA